MKPSLVIHIQAPNDRSGNPRRAYLVVQTDGTVKEAIDEGYSGDSAYRNKYGPLPEISIATTASEYKRWLKSAPGQNPCLPCLVVGFNPKKPKRSKKKINPKKLRIRI